MFHDQFLRLLKSIKDCTKRRMALSSGKRKSSPSSRQLQKRMCRIEETLDWLSLFLSSSQSSPFSGFQTPASQVDSSQLGMSDAMHRPGWAGPAGAASLEVEIVLASALGPTTTTGGFHAPGPGSGKAAHSALGTFHTVYGGGVGNSHLAPMHGGCHTTQDMEVSICHTAPIPGGQTPFRDIDGGVLQLPVPCTQGNKGLEICV
ncbi:hypothetical protein E2C01_016405 [Portunus trituberculatus]|uniref:Uncharacterized protein n=1 Tax=Portunus trituberculatus TaxID=210409 RepID=A0A5B7DNY8_PORTR|nr:hypothetical protein [Portunus trituberculatus]